MIELERTYLAKEIPKDLKKYKSKEIIDIYIPKDSDHAPIRIRKNGDKYEITKKRPVEGDASRLHEQNIILDESEFKEFLKLEGKKVHKIRYLYDYKGLTAEFDVFQGRLKGLVLVDFEFESEEQKNSFKMPDFCLADVTGEELIAGGVICSKTYEDLEPFLKKYNYKKLFIDEN
ncbi:hypothetical protein D6745_03525 [Candidatus Woesearchaeota archaeon]|nr:MAG: hypothetical protein D6745_03525 [Candidatus Woesearchaeota archaeon]